MFIIFTRILTSRTNGGVRDGLSMVDGYSGSDSSVGVGRVWCGRTPLGVWWDGVQTRRFLLSSRHSRTGHRRINNEPGSRILL